MVIATFLRLLGALAFIAGTVWAVFVFGAPEGMGARPPSSGALSGGVLMGRLIAATPGFGLAFCGLLLLGLGEAVWQLGRIARHAAKIVHNTADIADALEPPKQPKPRKDAAPTFNDAVQLFQARTGQSEPGAAIRDLAADALRQKGFLQ